MENIQILRTENSPEIDFNFKENKFLITGMSYLEDARDFFDPLSDKIEKHFNENMIKEAEFVFELAYYNSSSARIIFHLFDMLDALAKKGSSVKIIWRYFEDDDIMEEQGEELGEDLEHASFQLMSIS